VQRKKDGRIMFLLVLSIAISLLFALPAKADFTPSAPYAPANGDTLNDFEISDDGVLSKYTGNGGDLVIPEGVTEIADHTFSKYSTTGKYEGKNPLTGVKLPSTLTTIGESAFRAQTTLTGTISFPEGLRKMGYICFYDTALTGEVVIPENCSEVSGGWFYNTNITKITVLAPILTVNASDFTFSSMPELTEITVYGSFFLPVPQCPLIMATRS
jgi:hypothetical protein